MLIYHPSSGNFSFRLIPSCLVLFLLFSGLLEHRFTCRLHLQVNLWLSEGRLARGALEQPLLVIVVVHLRPATSRPLKEALFTSTPAGLRQTKPVEGE